MKIEVFNEWTNNGLYQFDLQLLSFWYDNKVICFIILNFALRINWNKVTTNGKNR